MALGILTLLSALTISAIAIYYSVAGLAAIFAAAVIPIIIMGVALEVGKLVTAVWLHKYWSRATWWLKTYLSIAVLVLMFITSMGIFGFLSKAHIEQTSAGEESVAQVERINNEISRQQDIVKRAEEKIQKLETTGTGNDANIQTQIDKEQERIDNAYKRIQPAIDEQQLIIDSQAELYEKELAKIDQDMETLQGYIDNGETAKAQQMIGASADGVFGKKTAEKIGEWQEAKQQDRLELISKIETASNNPQARAAADEIKRLRKTVEKQIADSNTLINRLRSQLGNTDKADDIDTQVDEQNLRIKNANNEIDTLTEEKFALEGEYRKLEAEVGPIKYIAEFVYGENADNNMLEEAVRWVIIVIIFVFDPLAVLLLIASQYTFHWSRQDKEDGTPPSSDPDPQPDPEPPYTDEEWDEAHRDNYEFDRAKKIDENIPPEIKNENDTREDSKNTEEGTQASSEAQDEESIQGQTETDPTVAGTKEKPLVKDLFKEMEETDDLEKWNTWVNAANAMVEEDEDEDWDEAKKAWKKDNPDDTLKHQRHLLKYKMIDQLPWESEEYQNLNPKYKIMPELVETEYFDKEGFDQIKKTAYQQNEEQTEGTLWSRVKRSTSE